MKTLIKLAIAGAAACLMSIGSASAAFVTVDPAPPGTNESDIVSCIFGNNSQGCPTDFLLPAGAPNGSVTDLMRTYEVSEIRALVGDFFNIGIDSNTAPGTAVVQILTKFTLELVGGGVLFELNPADFDTATGIEINTPVAQGNGFTDYIMGLFSLAGLNDDDEVKFTISLTGLTDGAEQFYFLDAPEVPIPGAIWLMGAGLAGLGFAGRKKKAA